MPEFCQSISAWLGRLHAAIRMRQISCVLHSKVPKSTVINSTAAFTHSSSSIIIDMSAQRSHRYGCRLGKCNTTTRHQQASALLHRHSRGAWRPHAPLHSQSFWVRKLHTTPILWGHSTINQQVQSPCFQHASCSAFLCISTLVIAAAAACL